MASVLIIDDDTSIRRVLRTALERAGHQVEEAGDGAEGMARYRSSPADLVVTDVYMPDQDGIETIQQLRAEFPSSRILAISGGSVGGASGTLTDAMLFGADATLAKPFTVQELVAAVAGLLSE
ncbi:MAG TPA: response regulator [Longimicrobiales bacterium]|nr:response regulator [Longimicrobiales bacterium]